MSFLDSTTYTAQTTAAGNAGKMIDTAELISGKSAFLQIHVLNTGGLIANDTINLGYVPSGMTVIPGQITITTVVTSGSGTFKIGTAADDDAIAAAASSNTVGNGLLNSTVPSYKATERTLLIATAVGTLAALGEFYINIPLVNSN